MTRTLTVPRAVPPAAYAAPVLLPAVAVEPAARCYVVADAAGSVVDQFRTASTGDGRSSDENAVTNLIEWSQHHRGDFVLFYLPYGTEDTVTRVPLAEARAGVGNLLVDPDALAADSRYGHHEPA